MMAFPIANKTDNGARSLIIRLLFCMMVMLLVFALYACEQPAHTVRQVEVKTIRISPVEVNMAVGDTLQFSAMLGDASGNMLPKRQIKPTLRAGSQGQSQTIGDRLGRTGRIVAWSSSLPSRVGVDEGGMVTALAAGNATITARSEGQSASAKVIVSPPAISPLSVSPAGASLPIGESIQLAVAARDGDGKVEAGSIIWSADKPSLATVSKNGLVQALGSGTVTITAQMGGQSGKTMLRITPEKTISGLDFPGNAGVGRTMRFEFANPLPAYPATYIWRVYPRQQQSYYTAFFWGNNGSFYSSNTYYGFHPYPDWKSSGLHYWEIAAPPGGDFISDMHVTYDRWYIQVAICRQAGNRTTEEFYWDWPDTTKVVRHTGERYGDPPLPALVVGDAPWNPGHEVWDGVIRGFQFYDTAMSLDEISKEIASPGSLRNPWYLNLDPTPRDILDKSGKGHHPAWVGPERPALWSGRLIGNAIVRSSVIPR